MLCINQLWEEEHSTCTLKTRIFLKKQKLLIWGTDNITKTNVWKKNVEKKQPSYFGMSGYLKVLIVFCYLKFRVKKLSFINPSFNFNIYDKVFLSTCCTLVSFQPSRKKPCLGKTSESWDKSWNVFFFSRQMEDIFANYL